ncbi:alpha/beta hydrolase [Neorhodopirellula lusitana]|uniref:alpha/beta hydrolase n=1 Tax=Neorhodopirellula lusitana TaxID=445327 RepID=UPI0024B6B263|nr:esterase [Neorhodopirellula lusitana]
MRYLTVFLLLSTIGCSQSPDSSTDNSTNQATSRADNAKQIDPAIPWGGLNMQTSGTPLDDAEQIVVLLHGYGSSGSDLVPLSDFIVGDSRAFVFPAGPVPLGDQRLAWGTNQAELDDAFNRLVALVRYTSKTYPNAEITVGGFSQGATLSSLLLTEASLPIRNLLLYSPANVLEPETIQSNANVEVLIAHGRQDEVLSFQDSADMNSMLKQQGIATNWQPFDGPHTITEEVLDATQRQLSP